MPMSDAVSSEGPKTTGIQQRSSALSLTHRDFSSLFESFDDVMHCIWWDLQSLYNLTLRNVDVEDVPQSFLRTLSQIGEPLLIFTSERLCLLLLLLLLLDAWRSQTYKCITFILAPTYSLHRASSSAACSTPPSTLSPLKPDKKKRKSLFKPVLHKYCTNNDLMFLPGFNTYLIVNCSPLFSSWSFKSFLSAVYFLQYIITCSTVSLMSHTSHSPVGCLIKCIVLFNRNLVIMLSSVLLQLILFPCPLLTVFDTNVYLWYLCPNTVAIIYKYSFW